MKNIENKIRNDFILGAIKYKDEFYFYLMPIAWWILNYKKYDPMNSIEDDFDYRNNIFVVTNEKVEPFLESIEEDKISQNELLELIYHIDKKYPDDDYSYLNFLIDFDKKQFINGFPDIELEEYLPNEEWKGIFDAPLNYLPSDLQKFWDSE